MELSVTIVIEVASNAVMSPACMKRALPLSDEPLPIIGTLAGAGCVLGIMLHVCVWTARHPMEGLHNTEKY